MERRVLYDEQLYREIYEKIYEKRNCSGDLSLRALSHLRMRSERGEKAVYEITAEGSAQESGVIALQGLR